MPHRLFVEDALALDQSIPLGHGPTRHTQVLRMQPGDEVVLFNGQGGEWVAEIEQMSRAATHVRVRHYTACSRELPGAVTLAIGMPANERMDWLVEKAAELGATAIQPLDCQRSVLRLSGPRATKRVAHWQAIAIAACEQSGRTAVPVIHPIQPASDWLGAQASTAQNGSQFVLSLRDSIGLSQALPAEGNLPQACFLSGPEGGLTDDEEDAALAAGFHAVSLGPRTLRADTAPITALAIFGSRFAAAR